MKTCEWPLAHKWLSVIQLVDRYWLCVSNDNLCCKNAELSYNTIKCSKTCLVLHWPLYVFNFLLNIAIFFFKKK